MAKERRPAAKKGVAEPATAAAPKQTTPAAKAAHEADAELQKNTYRADMGEALPPQKGQLNPNRAK